jgi:hypothetical protein
VANEETEYSEGVGTPSEARAETASQTGDAGAAKVAVAEEATEVEHQEFVEAVYKSKDRGGCSTEPDVGDIHSAMSAELVEYHHGKWVSTGKIVDITERWGVRVRFSYWGKLARCLTGDIDMTLWWDGFRNLPEGSKGHRIPNVRPCRPYRQYVVIIEMTNVLQCPQHAGVYDFGVTLTFGCCGKPVIYGFCDLHGVNMHC